jgi:hypothetical protein
VTCFDSLDRKKQLYDRPVCSGGIKARGRKRQFAKVSGEIDCAKQSLGKENQM